MDYYTKPTIIDTAVGNNAFSFQERHEILGTTPQIIIPSRRNGTWEDVSLGDKVTFEEIVDGQLFSKTSIAHFIACTNPYNGTPMIIFDNHNHALFFWAEALSNGQLSQGATLLHIDQHKDMREPAYYVERKEQDNLELIYEYTNYVLNVGNFIKPARELGIIDEIILLDNEPSFGGEYTKENTIVDIDLDLFAEEMDHMDFASIVPPIQKMLRHARFTTIATSPFFIEQSRALHWLHKLFSA